MDLRCIQTFETIVREGSFTRAAVRLCYTQSTITFQMHQLEAELGVRLFEKAGRSMVLTDAGRQLVPYAREVLDSVEKMRGFDQELSACRGELRAGVGETLLCFRMPPVLQRFHAQAPQARLRLKSMNCFDIRDALLCGELDAGVFYEDVGGFAGRLSTVPMGEFELAAVASPRTAAEVGELITPGRALDVPFLINEPMCIFRRMFEHYLAGRAITLSHVIELWSIPTIKRLVCHDIGITCLPRFAVEEELACGALCELPTAMQDARIHAVCAWRTDGWKGPLLERFTRCCAQGVDDRR